MVTGDGAASFDPYQGIDAFPVMPDSTYQYLEATRQRLAAARTPNGLEPDTAILLRTNRSSRPPSSSGLTTR